MFDLATALDVRFRVAVFVEEPFVEGTCPTSETRKK